MPLQGYECNSCSYTLGAENVGHKSIWCPSCRATMYEAALEVGEDWPGYTCPECGFSFCVSPKARPPYKCPRCNYTFPSEPYRKVEHKL